MIEVAVIILIVVAVISNGIAAYQARILAKLLKKLVDTETHIGEPAPHIQPAQESWRNSVL